jgi:hypothetical protein
MADNNRRGPRKEINTTQVVRYLSKVFANATESMGRNAPAGSDLYKLQVEFAYYVDEITRGPSYQVSKVIADCNSFIDGIVAINKK